LVVFLQELFPFGGPFEFRLKCTSSGIGGYIFRKDYLEEPLSPARMNFKRRVQKKGSRYYASLEKEEKRIHGNFAIGYKKKVLADIPVEVRTKKEKTTPDKKNNTKNLPTTTIQKVYIYKKLSPAR
jgi:hypothetical protein